MRNGDCSETLLCEMRINMVKYCFSFIIHNARTFIFVSIQSSLTANNLFFFRNIFFLCSFELFIFRWFVRVVIFVVIDDVDVDVVVVSCENDDEYLLLILLLLLLDQHLAFYQCRQDH